MSSRRPPLHTCGLSFLEIVDNVCTKAQHLNGPIGSITKKIARITSLASPFIYAFQYELLLIFSFLDDRIFALEYVVEAIFPPSGYAFDKIDELVRIAEILPGKFDEAVNKFPTIIHQVPFLDGALIRAISCLNFMLMQWGSGNIKEKEILIDMNCNESRNESGVDRKEKSLKNGVKEDGGPKSGTVMKCTYKDALEKVLKTTYKDALEKGTKEDSRNQEKKVEGGIKKSIETNGGAFKKGTKKKIKDQEKIAKIETEKSSGSKEVNKDNTNANTMEKKISNGDQILELFESAWLASPSPRNMETSSSFSLSVSDQW